MNSEKQYYKSIVLIFVLFLTLFSSPTVALEKINNQPQVVETLDWNKQINANQQWNSNIVGFFRVHPEYRHIIKVTLNDNLTTVFGEDSIYRLYVNFSLLEYSYPAYKFKTFTLSQNSSHLFTIDFNATTEFYAFTKLSLLSGNSKNSTVDLNFRLTSLHVREFDFHPNQNDYSINTTSFPSKFSSEDSFLWYDAGNSFVFLPSVLIDEVQDYLIEIFITVHVIKGDSKGQVRVELNEDEDMIDLEDEETLAFEIVIQRDLELQVFTDTVNVEFEFTNITIYIPLILEERTYDFPELPPGGIIIGTMLLIGSTLQVYLYNSTRREIEEESY